MSRFDPPASPAARQRFTRFAWGVLAYMLLVILWGAFVRATGAGAGCGSHWPLCNGEVVPQSPAVETLVELSHRLTSALAGLLVIGLLVWAYRLFPRGHRVRKAALGSFVFILTEGAVGAALVLFEWVATDASLGRTLSIALHLNNTFILVAFLTLTAWWAGGGPPMRWRGQGAVAWLLGSLVFLVMLVSTFGALTALGDTLFRVAGSAEALSRTADATAHHLERLRLLHPVLALLAGAFLFISIEWLLARRPGADVRRWGRGVQLCYISQIFLGLLNIWLKAPVWMQLVHLLVADFIWIALILFCNATLAAGVVRRPAPLLQPRTA